jgi:hypothetical protein
MGPQNLTFQRDMPAELRAKVYADMSPPLKCHIGEYHAILCTNRFLRAEVEGEWIRNMCRFLQDIMKSWSETYSPPLYVFTPVEGFKAYWPPLCHSPMM